MAVGSNPSNKLLINRLLTILMCSWNLLESLAKKRWILSGEINSFYPELAKAYPDLPAIPYQSSIWKGHLFESPKDMVRWISEQEKGKRSVRSEPITQIIPSPVFGTPSSGHSSPIIDLDSEVLDV